MTSSPTGSWRSNGRVPIVLVVLLFAAACVAGGETLSSGEGASVLVPVGAWDGSESLQIVVDVAPLPLPDGFSAVSEFYALLPHGATFDLALTVTLPYSAGFAADLTVLRLGDDMDEIWEPVAGASFNGSVASFETLQFSWYVVAEVAALGDDDDASDDDDSAAGLQEYVGDLTIVTDAEMSAFCATYDRVTGNVDVSTLLVTDGTLLDCLTEVGGDFGLHDTLITELQLPALESVGGLFEVTSNGDVVDVAAPALVSAGEVGLSFNPSQVSLDLPGLETVSGDLRLEADAALSSVSLSALVQVDGTLEVSGTEALAGLDLGDLESVGGDLVLDPEVPMESLGLAALRSIGGSFQAASYQAFVELDLGSLETVGGALNVFEASELESLLLGSLRSVGDMLRIEASFQLTELPLGALEEVGSAMLHNLAVVSLDLSSLEEATAGGLSIQGPDAVDLSALATVAGSLSLDVDGPGVIDLPLLATAGTLSVGFSNEAPAIQAPLLTALTGDLLINNNPLLATLTLPSLGAVGGDLMIASNPVLPTSAAEALRDQVGLANIGGNVSIFGNGPG